MAEHWASIPKVKGRRFDSHRGQAYFSSFTRCGYTLMQSNITNITDVHVKKVTKKVTTRSFDRNVKVLLYFSGSLYIIPFLLLALMPPLAQIVQNYITYWCYPFVITMVLYTAVYIIDIGTICLYILFALIMLRIRNLENK